jgi:hypothetical protein
MPNNKRVPTVKITPEADKCLEKTLNDFFQETGQKKTRKEHVSKLIIEDSKKKKGV